MLWTCSKTRATQHTPHMRRCFIQNGPAAGCVRRRTFTQHVACLCANMISMPLPLHRAGSLQCAAYRGGESATKRLQMSDPSRSFRALHATCGAGQVCAVAAQRRGRRASPAAADTRQPRMQSASRAKDRVVGRRDSATLGDEICGAERVSRKIASLLLMRVAARRLLARRACARIPLRSLTSGFLDSRREDRVWGKRRRRFFANVSLPHRE